MLNSLSEAFATAYFCADSERKSGFVHLRTKTTGNGQIKKLSEIKMNPTLFVFDNNAIFFVTVIRAFVML